MVFNRSLLVSFVGRTSFAVLLVLALTAAAFAQDPTGRPDPKGKKPPVTPKKTPVKAEPVPVTVTLTVLTTPPESTVFVNGEERGVTNGEGKIQFEKLPLGRYSIEVRKDGYNTMLKGFEAGTESPTVVFKLEPKLDDYIREFNGLVASGKLAGPASPNAFELLEKLATTYGDRAEVTTLKSVLAAKLSETITPVITQTVTSWRTVTRDHIVRALDASTNSLTLKKDDSRVQAQAAYLRGAIALRDWQAAPAKVDSGTQGDAGGSVSGPGAARAEFESALKLDESLVAARYQLGVVSLASSDAAGAEAALVRVIQQEPRWAAAHMALGQAYYGGGKFKEAMDAYRKASEIEPSNAAPVAGLGLARIMKGEKDGLKDIERATKLEPNSALPHLNLAIYYSQSKNKRDWSKAEEEFKKAIQLNSQNIDFQNSSAERMLADVQKRKR
jgi:tetratricopeptide repeat protein/PEGA domain-containing protein